MTSEQRQLMTSLAWTFVPPRYRPFSVIAGGWATDIEKATDIDLYLLGNPDAEEIVNWLEKHRTMYRDRRGAGKYGTNANRVIADVLLPFHDSRVQLIASEAVSADQLLDGFDITTHMHALTQSGQRIIGSKSTEINEPGRIVRFDTPEDTARRAEKIGRRYCIDVEGMFINSERGEKLNGNG